MNKLIISNKIKIFINIYCLILNQISFKINVLIININSERSQLSIVCNTQNFAI